MSEAVPVREALGQVLAMYVERNAPRVEYDPEWPSPCVAGEPDEEDMVPWRPVPMADPPDFRDLEAAAGVPLHPDAAQFFGSWWAGEVEARHGEDGVILRTLWNDEELEKLQEFLREHWQAQAEAGVPVRTVPIALTGSDPYFALDNRTGEVFLEEPGEPPLQRAAPSLAAFLLSLEAP